MNATAEPIRQTRVPGSELDFEELYRQYKSRVFSTAYRMLSNYADAEDVTQDIFVKVFQKLPTFRGDSAVSTWIYRIAVNACLDFRRRRKRHQTVPLDDEAEQVSVGLNLGRLIESFIPKMPRGYREVFVLHDIQGMKHEEIGRILGITDGASKSQLHRARAFLKRELAPYVDERRWRKEV